MSIQWTLIATCMYSELIVTFLLLLPFISAKRWHSFFKSSFLSSIAAMSHIYFKISLAVLILCFVDAIREMHKYSSDPKDHSHDHSGQHLDVEMQQHMRLFRAQRNFYISGFSLCLCFIVNRLMTLISTLARTEAECEAAMKQAKSASAAASQLMKGEGKEEGSISTAEAKKLQEKMKKMEAEKDAALKQAESVSREYDRLMSEMSKLQAVKEPQTDKKAD